MDVIVDHPPPFVFKQEPGDALEAVSAVSDFLRSQGRAILSLRVDGQAITPERLAFALKGKPLTAFHELLVTSEQIATLVHNCLTELDGVLPELSAVCHRLAEVFQGGHPESGYEPFQQLAGIWKTIKERELQVINALDVDCGRVDIEGMPLDQLHAELNRYIDEAAEALKAGDCVLLGDLLEYELAPRAEKESAIVALLRVHAQH